MATSKMMLNVEIFNNGKFVAWFPATSMKEMLGTIARYEGAKRMADIKLTYLVFQKDNRGRYMLGSKANRYTKVCRINSRGNEVPEFLKEIDA